MKFITLLNIYVTYSNAARILVCVPTPSISHQKVFYPLITELLIRKHEVVFITTDSMYHKGNSPANLTEIDTHDMSYKLWRDVASNLITGSIADQFNQIENIHIVMRKSFELQIHKQEVQDLMQRKVHFDLLIIESCVKSALSLSHVFKAPVILMSSLGTYQDNYHLMGAPQYPKLLYPNCMHQKLNNMNIISKIRALWHIHKIEAIFSRLREEENRLVKKLFGPETATLEEMGDNVHMLFLNVYPLWEMNRPTPPGVIFIGGIHQQSPKKLPKDIQAYLDSSIKGVVYFSMGTNVNPSTLSPEKVEVLKNGLAKLQYDVLIKWDYDNLLGKGKNTKVAKWLPQADILRHPNVKAFVTQGGLQSFDEALTGGVPIVGIPILADQWYNVELYVKFKIGVGLLMDELTENRLVNAINTVIYDPNYRRNLINLREKVRDQPQSALERAVWWTEHVIRHKGASHLRAPAANMSWTKYLDVELWAAVALIALTVLAAAATVLYAVRIFILKLYVLSMPSKLKSA